MECRPANNDIITGVAKVGAYLGDQPTHPHLITGAPSGPLLYFVDDLEFIQDEITNYYWDKSTLGDMQDKPIDRDDHALDTLKYMLSHLPDPSEIKIPKSAVIPPWMFWHELNDDGTVNRRA